MRMKTQVRLDQAAPRPTQSALTLLESARHELAEGARDTSAASKYAAAHLAALRAAAAVVAARPDPSTTGRRRRPQSVWDLPPRVEPTFSGWATYFAGTARKRTAVGTGLRQVVSLQEAEKLLHDAQTFVQLAADAIRPNLQGGSRSRRGSAGAASGPF